MTSNNKIQQKFLSKFFPKKGALFDMRTMSGKDALVDLMRREDVENVFYFNIGNPNLETPEK